MVLGAKSSDLGHFGLTMAFFFVAGCGVVVRAMEIIKTQPKIASSQKSKSI